MKDRPRLSPGWRRYAVLGVVLATAIGILIPAAASAVDRATRSGAEAAKNLRVDTKPHPTESLWAQQAATSADRGRDARIKPRMSRAFALDRAAIRATLAQAPRERTKAASEQPLVLSLPAPGAGFQRFALQESPIMAPALAQKHSEIKTYSGRGIDDLAATIRLDVSPLGFHASVRSPEGNWYIDPAGADADGSYLSYYTRDLAEDPDGVFVEREGDEADAQAQADALATNGGGPSAGSVLRTYRLALVTDPTYATYFGAANVTAAKVALMNRVTQVYEDETSIRMILIADTDKLNLNTPALATEPNGPCGAAGCFTPAQIAQCSNLARIRIVVGQIIGASNYDIGHLALGTNGGGVANLGVVGGNSKAQGCTGLLNPVGDFYAVDYVAHEMGHQFAGNHTFNGNQLNCAGGNRNGANSVEPGSGSSIMAYAGICRQDNLQAHSDPYWSQRSFQEITTYVTSDRPAINEVQTASLYDFDGTDSFTITYEGATTPAIVNGTNYSAAGIQAALQGPSEVQTVALAGYDTNGDSYTLSYGGTDTVPIVRGQNNTAAGIAAALQGGNEQQQVSLTGFNGATQSFQVQIGENVSAVLGAGGTPISSNNVAAAINAIAGFAGTVAVQGAGNNGFTATFAGASAGLDMPTLAIVNCTAPCASAVRENVKGGGPVAGWPEGGTVAVSGLTDSGYALTFSGAHQGSDVGEVAVTNGIGVTGTVVEAVKGGVGILPVGATATVAGFGAGTFNTTGFQVTFGGTIGLTNLSSFTLTNLNGATGFVGETAKGGAIDNQGWTITPTGNTPPTVGTHEAFTIPYRTPFALTGGATDPDGDTLTYLWEQNNIGVTAVALVNPLKTTGPLFRQFGTGQDATVYDPTQYESPGENHVTTNPTRVFPDLAQIVAGNTNAAGGDCPGAPAPPSPPTGSASNVPQPLIDCYSEFLPTAVYAGPMSFRLTARDGNPGAGGIASSDTTITLAPGTGPFLITSHATSGSFVGGATQTVTWDVAGTSLPPIGTTHIRISQSADGGVTYPFVLAESTPNDGSQAVPFANVTTAKARIKVEAVGNVFFAVSDADIAIESQSPRRFRGDGELVASRSAGTRAADDGSTIGFDFDVRYKGDGKPKHDDSKLSLSWRADGVKHEVALTTVDLLGIAGSYGELIGTARLTVGQGPSATVTEGLRLRVFGTEGNVQSNGAVGFELWNGATLVFSSAWNGWETVQQELQKGKIKLGE